jgi:hypothetical protein
MRTPSEAGAKRFVQEQDAAGCVQWLPPALCNGRPEFSSERAQWVRGAVQ